MKKQRTLVLSAALPRTELIASFEAMKVESAKFVANWHGHVCDSPDEAYWHLLSKADRDKAAKSGAAMEDGSYPILSCTGDNSVDTAIHAVGRGNASHDSIRAHIIKRADSLGCSTKIPDNWNKDGSLAAAANVVEFLKPLMKATITFAEVVPPAAPPAKTQPCPTCAGSGSNPDGSPCANCKGDGKVPAKDAVDQTADNPPDDTVLKLVQAIGEAIDEAKKGQAVDPDADTDPNDKDVAAALVKLSADYQALLEAQQKDTKNDKPVKADAPAEPKAPADTAAEPAPTMNPTTPANTSSKLAAEEPTMPIDEQGNVHPDAVCATNGCGHLGSVHQDTDTGENSGACSAPGCDCPEMTFATNNGDDTTGADDAGEGVAQGGGPNNDGGDDVAPAPSKMSSLFGPLIPVDLMPPPMAAPPMQPAVDMPTIAPADPTTNEAPVVEGATVMGPAFVIPVGIIEGQATDDGRSLAVDSLSWLNPPLPLMGQVTTTHDPNGMDQNAPAVLCGRIDSVERTTGDDGTQLISAKGFFLPDDDGMYYAGKVEAMGRVGVSADVKVFNSIVMPGGLDDFGNPDPEAGMTEVVTEGELAGFCIVVPSPAFPQCYIMLDDGETHEPIPVQSDEDSEMTASVQSVHFMAAERCEPCGEMDIIEAAESIVAGAFVDAPMRPPKAWFEDPGFFDGDDRMVSIGGGKFACPLTVTPEGEVYGHIAPFGTCHTGYKGKCVTAPHSAMNYSQFMRAGQVLVTAEGEKVRVGPLTFATGHADLSGRTSSRDVVAHYDNTGSVWADVIAGEDEFGVWVHGALRPNLTDLQLRQIMAASPSGDWRECEGNLELMAILQVNQPGFPVAMVAAGSTKALVAAGAFTMWRAKTVLEEDFSEENYQALVKLAAAPMLRLVLNDARNSLDELVQDQRQYALSVLDSL
jgi:hypothetical protein